MEQPIQTTGKDAPLRYDVRLLGRILRETVRAQGVDGNPQGLLERFAWNCPAVIAFREIDAVVIASSGN
jgi:hypothetical protein